MASNIEERLQFIKIDEHTKDVIRSLQPFLHQELPAALDVLYNQIRAFPETRRFFSGDAQMSRAHGAQTRHWDIISSGLFDERYVNAAHANGEVHARIGLEPRWYMAGYALVLEPLIHALINRNQPKGWAFGKKGAATGEATAEALVALVKCVMLDMDLVISTYFESAEAARRQAEENAIKAERALITASIGAAVGKLADKDLSYRLTEDLPSAYHQLQTDLNTALQQLEQAMGQVANSAQTIKSGTSEISTAADDLSSRTEQQAASLEETAAAIEEVTSTVGKTAQNAVHAAAIVAATKVGAEKSHEIVSLAIDAMRRIKKSSQEIAQIIGVIDEIAFQTNLLALNAGVEAARAGDAGRGFAVVASEVRALAQRSAQAAKEIASLISSSTREVDQGVDLVGQTGTALEEIVAKVSDVDQVVSEIAAGAKEQATGLREINVAVGQMDQATQRNAAMVEETTAATRNLRLEMEELLGLIAHFNIGAEVVSQNASARTARPVLKVIGNAAGRAAGTKGSTRG
ncbi:MAG: methyl-accepting chemotaxis protein [Methylovirgula sp.]